MADPEIMKLYASLVEDPAIRDVMLERILNEFQLARDGISALLGSSPADRRPRLLRTLERRAQGLAWLHRERVRLLRAWRAKPDEGALRPLLLAVNAIAMGQKTTG
jgi:phosphoenolpyruvate carboxylase